MIKKYLMHVLGIFICLVFLISSVFLTYQTEEIAGEIANKEILTEQDVIQTLQMRGITFKPDTSHNPQNYEVENTYPTIYQDSYGNFLYIYTFGSFVERPGFLSEFELKEKFFLYMKIITLFLRYTMSRIFCYSRPCLIRIKKPISKPIIIL